MSIKYNNYNTCNIIRIEEVEVNYAASFIIDDEFYCEIDIQSVERNCFDLIKDKPQVHIVVKFEQAYITFVNCQMSSYTFSHSEKEVDISIKFYSPLVLCDYEWNNSKDICFTGFVTSITEITELLGYFPYNESYSCMVASDHNDLYGKNIFKKIGTEYSFFVIPNKTMGKNGVNVSIDSKIRYDSEKRFSISELRELTDRICLFYEILTGEVITLGESIDLFDGDLFVKAIGLCNYPKTELNIFKTPNDDRSYLRKRLFKISDFDDIHNSILAFDDLYKTCLLAFEAYKQVLLDEEVRIGTYNKFLKLMQIVEGYQRDIVNDEEQKRFNDIKNSILEKLEDDEKTFIEKYTNNNGQEFGRCLKDFTINSLQILGFSKTKAKSHSNDLIRDMINDRDVYTHASKIKNPVISVDKLMQINYLYKTFFRISVLRNIGMSNEIIKKRLLHDRRLVILIKNIFHLDFNRFDEFYDTGEFDRMMW